MFYRNEQHLWQKIDYLFEYLDAAKRANTEIVQEYVFKNQSF